MRISGPRKRGRVLGAKNQFSSFAPKIASEIILTKVNKTGRVGLNLSENFGKMPILIVMES